MYKFSTDGRNCTLWMLCWDFFCQLSICLLGRHLDDCCVPHDATVSVSDNFHLLDPPTLVETTMWNWRHHNQWSILSGNIDRHLRTCITHDSALFHREVNKLLSQSKISKSVMQSLKTRKQEQVKSTCEC